MSSERAGRRAARAVIAAGLAGLLTLAPARAGRERDVREDAQSVPRSATLDMVEAQIARAFPEVRHLSPAELAERLKTDPGSVVLVDVRAADEFAVSRLAGAVRVAPEARSAGEIARAAGGLEGKIIVAYCAIGLRSARLIVRLEQALKERGAGALYNLSGGAFRWRNEQRPLIDDSGPTTAIHPFTALWRTLLTEPAERR